MTHSPSDNVHEIYCDKYFTIKMASLLFSVLTVVQILIKFKFKHGNQISGQLTAMSYCSILFRFCCKKVIPSEGTGGRMDHVADVTVSLTHLKVKSVCVSIASP